MRVAKRRNGEWYAVERERFDRNQLRKKDLLNALGISALSRAPPSPRLSMGINIHDPLVQIKGAYPYPPPFIPPALLLNPLPSHRIRLWFCRHMHDLGPSPPSLVSLLVG